MKIRFMWWITCVSYPSNNWSLGEERQSEAKFLSKKTIQHLARLEPRSSDLKFKVLTAQFIQAPCLHDYALTTIKPCKNDLTVTGSQVHGCHGMHHVN